LEIAITIVFILYTLLVGWLIIGWRKATQRIAPVNTTKPLVSVVVAVRNEEANILNILNDLAAQTYPDVEILVVDDHSHDSTTTVISNVSEKSPPLKEQLKLLNCTIEFGKKAALTLGISAARGEIILTTDADCRLPANWIEATVEQFSDNVKMVVGGVRILSGNFFSRLQQLEFASLIGSGAATLGWQMPTMANGANLAFHKQTFNEVKGYEGNEQIPSGDDEFLLRKFYQYFPNSVVFNTNPDSVPSTKALASVNGFFQQRLRWGGKWKLHKDNFSKVLAISIFACQLTFLLTSWLIIFQQINLAVGLSLLLIKVLIEVLFFRPVVRYLSIPFSWLAFIVLQFIYPYYVVSVALASNLMRYQWKARKY